MVEVGSPRKAVTGFAETTSMHGIPSLIKATSHKSKFFWLAVCTIGLGMFIFMLTSLIMKYFSFPVVVTVKSVSMWMIFICRFNTEWLSYQYLVKSYCAMDQTWHFHTYIPVRFDEKPGSNFIWEASHMKIDQKDE